MKLFDKLKDLFTDTEEVEEEVDLEEELKEEYKIPKEKLPKVMQDVIEKEEQKAAPGEFKEPPKREERKFSFPVDFESDFEIKNERLNILEEEKKISKLQKEPKEKDIYPEPKVEIRNPQKFRASPVISPVYGVLDKNYTKDEVKEKDDESNEIKRASQKVDFESVRKKAFGNLTDDIKDNLMCENCELYKEVKRISSLKEDDILYDMTVDEDNGKEELTIEKAYDNYEDFGVSYEPDTRKSYSDKVNIVNHNDEPLEAKEVETKEELPKEDFVIDTNKQEDIKEEVEKIKEEPPKRSKKQDEEVSDEFFDLIDSMYKERTDEDE